MRFSPIPRGVYPGFSALDPEALAARGIRLVLADLDNTLVPYRVAQPSPQLTAWRDALDAQGIALFILSNSRKPGRAQNFAQALGVPFQGRSGKPRRRGYLQAMERMGCTPTKRLPFRMPGMTIWPPDTITVPGAGPQLSSIWARVSGLRRSNHP